MSVDELKNELKEMPQHPKGIIVSKDLMDDLKNAGEVEEREFCPNGLPSVKLKFPVLKGTNTIINEDITALGKKYLFPKYF